VLIVLKSGSLNLEFSGPLQACNGIALPLAFYLTVVPPVPKRHSSVGIVTRLRGRRPWDCGSIPEVGVELYSNNNIEK
jgi:hypothetical protein